MNDGIWYAEHLASELTSGKASSQEDRRLFAISYGSWQSNFSGDANVLGKTVSLDRHSFQIVGVTPPIAVASFDDSQQHWRLGHCGWPLWEEWQDRLLVYQ